MKVKDLIGKLQEIDSELEVILQKDAEGNGYSPLAGVDADCVYVADSTWSGEVFSANWSAEDADMDEDSWQDILNKPRAVVLYPVN